MNLAMCFIGGELPRPGKQPFPIGRPDVVLFDRKRKRCFLIVGIDETDKGGRRCLEAVDLPSRRLPAHSLLRLRH
jgi:hypothetical protein